MQITQHRFEVNQHLHVIAFFQTLCIAVSHLLRLSLQTLKLIVHSWYCLLCAISVFYADRVFCVDRLIKLPLQAIRMSKRFEILSVQHISALEHVRKKTCNLITNQTEKYQSKRPVDLEA